MSAEHLDHDKGNRVEIDLERDLEAELAALRARMLREPVQQESAGAPTRHATRTASPFITSFAPGFADRVMARVEHDAYAPNLADGLQRAFRRLAPLAAAAVLGVAALNVYGTPSDHRSMAERVLGLPAVNVASALASDDALISWGR